jgi:hypothetical protein
MSEIVELPLLPYAGTSGWSGSDTSRERAEEADASGVTSARQTIVLELIGATETVGMTWHELTQLTGWHHGLASGALSVLHKTGHLARVTERRNRCQIYVLPQYVNGRETAKHGRKSDAETIAELRAQLAEAHRLLEAANARAARQANTLRELWGR